MTTQDTALIPTPEVVSVLDETMVQQIRGLSEKGWGFKRIARELNLARNTVRRYIRRPTPGTQVRPARRALSAEQGQTMVQLFEGPAKGNASLVHRLLVQQGISISLRTVLRQLKPIRAQRIAQESATLRFETPPGEQMQIDFGQQKVLIDQQLVTIHFLVAVLGFSRRIFVKAFLSERADDWREGIAEAFRHFGGVPHTLLGDNARALVLQHNHRTSTLVFHPSYLAFCKEWKVVPKACRPYRAQTKGKSEAGVKFVKRNALAAQSFASFYALEQHLLAWMHWADQRIHGTLGQPPIECFEKSERSALRPLPSHPVPVRSQPLARKVAKDAMVDVYTVRYSVPFRLVGEVVEVLVRQDAVEIYWHQDLIATHRRCNEPHHCVIDPQHVQGILDRKIPNEEHTEVPSSLQRMGRSLQDYEEIIRMGAP